MRNTGAARSGSKSACAERGLDLRERGAQALHQCQRALGRLHHAALAHQQRIAGEFAQPRQRMAHRGLAEVQPLGRAADVALSHERGQHGEQVQVDAVEFDGFHRWSWRYRLRA
ncbi:hypothetical protein J2W23_005038 [Variovorax boronicumulans]|nr:hypothetical protein [Variovorax boronicumulans]